jgi:hypothetical protein
MRIRLTRKLAEHIDGVDLTRRRVGDLMDVPSHDAQLLMAEGWAHLAEGPGDGKVANDGHHRHIADATGHRSHKLRK